MWSFEEIRCCHYFPATKRLKRSPSPFLIITACSGYTLLNLALHLSKSARADRHHRMRRMTGMGPCALLGVSGSHECKRRASQDEFVSWALVPSSQTIMVPYAALKMKVWGLPGGLVGLRLCAPMKGTRNDPGLGTRSYMPQLKIPHTTVKTGDTTCHS